MRNQLILLGLLCLLPFGAVARSYSSGGGGHSYSSRSSSYSSSRHGSYSSFFSSSSSRKTSAFGSSFGSSFSSSGKTYSSGSTKHTVADESTTATHASESRNPDQKPGDSATASSGGTSHFFSPPKKKNSSFDAAAADAQQHQESQKAYTTWKTATGSPASKTGTYSGTYGGTSGGNSGGTRDSYDYRTLPVHHSYASQNYSPVYASTHTILVTRPVRLRQTYYRYYNRPQVIYNDPYSSMFWWWLLDQSIDSRTQWAYNYRYSMDPLRYQLLMNNAALANRVQALEAQQQARNNNYTPYGLDQDLLYNDAYVQNQAQGQSSPAPAQTQAQMQPQAQAQNQAPFQVQAAASRPTNIGRILFWALMLPAAGCVGAFVIWGVFFKRWA